MRRTIGAKLPNREKKKKIERTGEEEEGAMVRPEV